MQERYNQKDRSSQLLEISVSHRLEGFLLPNSVLCLVLVFDDVVTGVCVCVCGSSAVSLFGMTENHSTSRKF